MVLDPGVGGSWLRGRMWGWGGGGGVGGWGGGGVGGGGVVSPERAAPPLPLSNGKKRNPEKKNLA